MASWRRFSLFCKSIPTEEMPTRSDTCCRFRKELLDNKRGKCKWPQSHSRDQRCRDRRKCCKCHTASDTLIANHVVRLMSHEVPCFDFTMDTVLSLLEREPEAVPKRTGCLQITYAGA